MRGRRAQVETVEQTLQAEEIKYIPGTQGDTLKAVQNLPGVARAPYGIGLLPVWGSSPADTRVYIDGVNIPTLYHFGGLRSTVNSEMVDALTFVPGGYQADHGLGLGGIIDVQTRRPRTDGLHGYAQFDLLDGSAMLEGPLTTKLSFAAAARRSWVDKTLPYFTSSSLQLSPVYWDYQARLSYRATTRDTVDVFLLGSDDRLNVLATSSGMSATAGRLAHLLSSRHPRLDAAAGGRRHVRAHLVDRLRRAARSRHPLRRHGHVDRRAHPGPHHPRHSRRAGSARGCGCSAASTTKAAASRSSASGVARPPVGGASGASVGGFGEQTGSFDGMSSGFATDDLTVYANQVAPFLVATFSLFGQRLTVTPQMRLQISTFTGYPGEPESFTNTHVTADPRFSLRYKLTTRVALKGAVGPLHAAARGRRAVGRVRQPGPRAAARDPHRGRRRRRHHDHAAAGDGGVLEGHAQPGRPRRGRGGSRAGERRARARLRRRDPAAPADDAQLLRLDGVHAVAQRAHGSPRRAVAPLPLRSNEHPDAARELPTCRAGSRWARASATSPAIPTRR